MGNMKQYLGTDTLTGSFDQHRDLWKSPRGTVLRIEALVVLAITATFFHAAIGPCRRWSKSWIVHKGFLVAHAVSLSLGPYIIGVMQSSSTRSELYPIWAVSLYTLFGCVDPVTSYNGFDYKGSLSKIIYQVCFHCGYVLLMTISTMSSKVGKTSIGVLSGITFIKGIHTSLALVQQKRMRNALDKVSGSESSVFTDDIDSNMKVHIPLRDVRNGMSNRERFISLYEIYAACKEDKMVPSCYDASAALYLSHKLHQRFLGRKNLEFKRTRDIDFMYAWKLIGIEMGFLYDIFFTGNSFLHYYQAKGASICTLASLVAICFVAETAATHGMRSSRYSTAASVTGHGTNTVVVDTTSADVAITLAALTSLALLQLAQLIRCWTSNWARVALACSAARTIEWNKEKNDELDESLPWWMTLRESIVNKNYWFDRHLSQEKLDQYSLAVEVTRSDRHYYGDCVGSKFARLLALDYMSEVLSDMIGSDTTKKEVPVRLESSVKESIGLFLKPIKGGDSQKGNYWLQFLDDNDLADVLLVFSPETRSFSCGLYYTMWVMAWHVVTCHCELAEKMKQVKAEDETGASCPAVGVGEEREKNRRVAIALSNYCVYLVVSAPDLLPGPVMDIRKAYNIFATAARKQHGSWWKDLSIFDNSIGSRFFGIIIGHLVDMVKELLCDERSVSSDDDAWKVLSGAWVRLLVYGASYGDATAHMQHLSQGGEFITHVWAMLHHLGIEFDLTNLVDKKRKKKDGEEEQEATEIVVEAPVPINHE